MTIIGRYQESRLNIPIPGSGGCHTAILGVANLGVLAGLAAEAIFQDLRRSIPQGKRQISDREITDAINKAQQDHTDGTFTPRPRPKPVVQDGKAALQNIIDQGKISDEVDLWEASQIRLLGEPIDDSVLLLEILYAPTDLLWIGERHDAGILGETIRTAGEWIIHFRNGGKAGPHIIPNPLTGTPTMKKTGDGETYRGDGNTRSYRFCIAEFDNLTREDQIKFWSEVRLPVVALIDSAGKSVHAWIDIQKLAPVTTAEQWTNEIKGRLYGAILNPLGVDSACSNPARLSRLPGHFRTEKQAYQRLLWLSPEGRPICH
jgi:hypothetical protein